MQNKWIFFVHLVSLPHRSLSHTGLNHTPGISPTPASLTYRPLLMHRSFSHTRIFCTWVIHLVSLPQRSPTPVSLGIGLAHIPVSLTHRSLAHTGLAHTPVSHTRLTHRALTHAGFNHTPAHKYFFLKY